MTRFVVKELEGYPSNSAGDMRRPPGLSTHVLDTAWNHRIVGSFRSEDRGHGTSFRGGWRGRVGARAAAAELCRRLNEEVESPGLEE